MNPLFVSALGSIIRHVLTIGAGYFVSKGMWTTAEATDYVTALALAIIGVGWALWEKSEARAKFLAALRAPSGTPEENL